MAAKFAYLAGLLPLAFMGLRGGLWNFIRAIPTFIALAREIFRFLHETKDYFEREIKLRELHAAIQARDTAKINALFGSVANEPPPGRKPDP